MADRALFRFAMPKPVRIAGRSSSITNSFVNGIIPVVPPTLEQVDEALRILGMDTIVVCAYCGDPASEWDHLRPLVVGKQPTHGLHLGNSQPRAGLRQMQSEQRQ